MIIIIIVISFILLYICYSFVIELTQHKIMLEMYDRPKRLVVSLSTLPSRISKLDKVIDSIINNSVKPDLIYINIPEFSIREDKPYIINDDIAQKSLVYINRCDHDYGPLTKILPTILHETDPETVIICVDDDIEYDKNLIKHLLQCSNKLPDSTVCIDGWNYINLGFTHLPIIKFSLGTRARKVQILQCYNGVLYKRKFFDDDFIEITEIEECFTTDDIIISKYLYKKGIQIFSIPFNHKHKHIKYETDPHRLGYTNLMNNKWIGCINTNLSNISPITTFTTTTTTV